jgi:hypothetical protein
MNATFDFGSCGHLCCKEGKISKKPRAKTTSKAKNVNLPRPTLNEEFREGGYQGGQPLQVSNISKSFSFRKSSESSFFGDIVLENLEYRNGENPYSIPKYNGPNVLQQINYSVETISTSEAVTNPTVNTLRPPRRKSGPVGLRKQGTVDPQRGAAWALDDSGSESDDDLPLPENLLDEIMPKKEVITRPATCISVSGVQDSRRATGRMDASVPMSIKNEILFSKGVFSVDDIMECVEIV